MNKNRDSNKDYHLILDLHYYVNIGIRDFTYIGIFNYDLKSDFLHEIVFGYLNISKTRIGRDYLENINQELIIDFLYLFAQNGIK